MFVEKFISNFNHNSETDIAEESLYFTFTNKSKEILCFLGDYEQVPFDIVTTILHELRHLYQIEQAELGDQFFLLESEFVYSLNNSQKQKYNRLCDEFYRCGMFHDRILIEFVLSFVGSILNGGH